MCSLPERPEDAADKLAYIINVNIDDQSSISPRAVRKMIKNHWNEISNYAHTIHEETVSSERALEMREKGELKPLMEKYHCRCDVCCK